MQHISNSTRIEFLSLCYYAAWGGLKPTFRDYLSVPSSRVKMSKECPWTSWRTWQPTRRKNSVQPRRKPTISHSRRIFGRKLAFSRHTCAEFLHYDRTVKYEVVPAHVQHTCKCATSVPTGFTLGMHSAWHWAGPSRASTDVSENSRTSGHCLEFGLDTLQLSIISPVTTEPELPRLLFSTT